MPPEADPTPRPFHLDTPCEFTQADFDRFAELSGDHNPIHVDPGYARGTAFGATVAHGMLLFSRLRALMEHAYPGKRLQAQELMFPAPSYAGETLALTLDGAPDAHGHVDLRMQVRKADGRLGLDGSARLVDADAPLPGPDTPAGAAAAPSSSGASALPRFAALRMGDTAQVRRAFSAAELAAWAELAAMPAAPAAVPEPLIAALYSYLLGEELPGHGTNYLKQAMRFHGVAEAGEPLHASVAITRLRPDKALVNLDTRCTGADGRVLCTGGALVLFKC